MIETYLQKKEKKKERKEKCRSKHKPTEPTSEEKAKKAHALASQAKTKTEICFQLEKETEVIKGHSTIQKEI